MKVMLFFHIGDKPYDYILGIGNNAIRKKVAQLVLSQNKRLLNVIDITAHISEKTIIGRGNFIAKNAMINILAEIGDYCIINTGSIIEHECSIEKGVHIAPGAALPGNVTVGKIFYRSKCNHQTKLKLDTT